MYKVIAIAGTFDRLHKGHEHFISRAFDFGEKVLIGLTSDSFVKSKIFPASGGIHDAVRFNNSSTASGQFSISNFQTRKNELEKYLKEKNFSDRSIITTIDDVYGPSITNKEIDALVVTNETKTGGEKVNQKRKESGLPLLRLIIIPFVLAEDREKIASTRIRVGEIDRKGLLYGLRLTKYYKGIPEEIRMELKKPQGVLLKGDSDNLKSLGSEISSKLNELKSPFLITVGDEVTKLVNSLDVKPKLAIFDFFVNRKEKYHSLADLGFNFNIKTIPIVNPAGCISKEIVKAVGESIEEIIGGKEERIAIKITGEDDLAAVPAIMLSPLGSVVIYGQPGEGVAMVEVTEERKGKLVQLLGPKAHQSLAENG